MSQVPTAPWPSGTVQTEGWPAGSVDNGGLPPKNNWPADIPEWIMHIPKNIATVRIAHAVLAACAFLLFFPAGGIILRVSNHYHTVWVHALVQGFAFILFTASAGMGIYMAKHLHVVSALPTCPSLQWY